MLDQLLDHLVGAAEQRQRHGNAQCLRRFEVDDKFQLADLLYGQVGGLFSLKNPPDIAAS